MKRIKCILTLLFVLVFCAGCSLTPSPSVTPSPASPTSVPPTVAVSSTVESEAPVDTPVPVVTPSTSSSHFIKLTSVSNSWAVYINVDKITAIVEGGANGATIYTDGNQNIKVQESLSEVLALLENID